MYYYTVKNFFKFYHKEINYCLNNETSEIISRKTNVCLNKKTQCSPYYYCKEGICKSSKTTCKFFFILLLLLLILIFIHFFLKKNINIKIYQ